MFNTQVWTDGEQFTFSVNESDKEGLGFGDLVVLLTGINSESNNTRIYGRVVDTSGLGRLTILIERTVIE